MYLIRNYKLILFTILVFRVANSKAQDTINSASVEQKTYQLYVDKNWPELIKYGNMAIEKGFDYFYLRIRIGIAYYEKKNYCLAEGHFKKALEFNSSDELAQEYLYYCNVFTGKAEEARRMSKKFSKELAEKIGTDKRSAVGFVLIEGGAKINNNTTFHKQNTNTTEKYFQPAKYFQFGLNHYVKNSFSVFHAINFFKQQYHSAIPAINQPQIYYDNTVRQLQYYLKIAVPIKNNWLLSPAFHWVHKSYTSAIPPPPSNSMHRPPPPLVVKSSYYVGSLSIQKTIKKFTCSIGSTFSTIDNANQYIHFAGVSFAPLGNNRIIIGCTDYLNTKNNYATIYNSVSPFIYLQPLKRVSITTSYFYSNGTNNIIEDNGYLVNNSTDFTLSRYSFMANVYCGKHLALYGLYQIENKKEAVQSFYYHYNVFVAGIKIIP